MENTETKIHTLGRRRKKSCTLGITIGVFDLFHFGHARFLSRCYDHCDYLMVGVMSDYWVRVQKGHARPIESHFARMENVRHYVDNVFLMETLDLTEYLKIVDVWIKGDGQINMLPENYPCVYLTRTPGISTTTLVDNEKNINSNTVLRN